MADVLKINIEANNATGKGWEKVESEAKNRAKKIREAVSRDGGVFGNVSKGGGAGGGGGLFGISGGGMAQGLMQGLGFAAIVQGIKGIIGNISDIGHAAERVDFTPRNYQILKAVAEETGADASTIETSLARMTKAAASLGSNVKMQKAFKGLNIDPEAAIGASGEKLFAMLAKGYGETGNKESVFEIFGRGANKVMPALEALSKGYNAGSKNGIISDKDIDNAEILDKQVLGIERTIKSWGASALSGTVSFIQGFAGTVGALASGELNSESIAKDIAAAKGESPQDEAKKQKQADDKAAADEFDKKRRLELYKLEKEKEALKNENEDIEAKKVHPNADFAHRAALEVAGLERELTDKTRKDVIGGLADKWSGGPDMTNEEEAQDKLHRLADHGYDRQRRNQERASKRQANHLKSLEAMSKNKNLKGPWIDKLRKSMSDAGKVWQDRTKVIDYNKQIALANEEIRKSSHEIEINTRALKKLDKALTLGGAGGDQ